MERMNRSYATPNRPVTRVLVAPPHLKPLRCDHHQPEGLFIPKNTASFVKCQESGVLKALAAIPEDLQPDYLGEGHALP